jgi:hypothetical protein
MMHSAAPWLCSLGIMTVLGARIETAEACACCDAVTTYTPVGWTEAGGALLIEMTSNAACEHVHRLEIWHVGANGPAGCYDLNGDPDKRTACNSPGDPADSSAAASTPPSSRLQHFPRKPVRLEPRLFRVRQQVATPDGRRILSVQVEVAANGTWRRVWKGTVETSTWSHYFDGGDTDLSEDPPPIDVTLWPNPRRDRALLRLTYVRPGNGDMDALLTWVELPPKSSR